MVTSVLCDRRGIETKEKYAPSRWKSLPRIICGIDCYSRPSAFLNFYLVFEPCDLGRPRVIKMITIPAVLLSGTTNTSCKGEDRLCFAPKLPHLSCGHHTSKTCWTYNSEVLLCNDHLKETSRHDGQQRPKSN